MSENYKIIYIDEDEKDREDFRDILAEYTTQLDILIMHPYVIESDLINYILEEKFDAIVIDYRLYGKDPNIKYNGVEIIDAIHQIKGDFPAFVLTRNRDADEVDDKIQSVWILTKNELDNNPSEIVRKITKVIKFYNSENEKLKNELGALLKKKDEKGELGVNEMQRLKDLDMQIERRINTQRIIPDIIKDSDSYKKLIAVLDDAEGYLKKIKK